ncbi:MAG TPA: 4-hydroxy-tetrahydrodipicolinate synthase [Ilumatobacteraceae bacterium]|nr:4-hydroxy-tetrahydrodipicolinate synthase [Ilumatobacteraceae bacterium]
MARRHDGRLSAPAVALMARFGRILTAMVTPFDDAGELNVDAAVSLAKWLVEQGNEGLVVSGTTGESPVLSIDEKLTLFEAVVNAVTVPVIAGTTGSNTRHDIGLTEEAGHLGVAGILGVCPYYSRPSQAGIETHFRAIAGSTDLPVVLYDIPARTGRKIAGTTLVRLANDVPNIVALKDAAGNPGATAAVAANSPADFEIYSGDDTMTLPLLAVGAVGAIGVATHWCAPDHVEMFDAWDRGDIAGARRINARQLESYEFETGDDAPNPVPSKAMLRTLGHDVGECRSPMGPTPHGLERDARGVYERLVAARG